MSARAIFLGGALGVFGGCSLVVSTSGLSQEAPVAALEAGPDVVGDVEDVPTREAGAADVVVDVVDADASAPASGVVWPVNGHRYEVRIYPSPRTWTQAREDAVTSGGHLVTVTSEAEGAFVASLVYSRGDAFEGDFGPWIGAHQPEPNANDGGNEPAGGWAWVTGEAWSFEDWRGPEPNNNGGDEHFAHYFSESESNRGWNDVEDLTNFIYSAVIEYE